eukprot:COSAG06_NODE_1609_length_8943_cov_90.568182_4_plen_571_part_00
MRAFVAQLRGAGVCEQRVASAWVWDGVASESDEKRERREAKERKGLPARYERAANGFVAAARGATLHNIVQYGRLVALVFDDAALIVHCGSDGCLFALTQEQVGAVEGEGSPADRLRLTLANGARIVAHQSATGSDAPVTLRWRRSLLPPLGTAEVSATRRGVGHEAHTLETPLEWAARIDTQRQRHAQWCAPANLNEQATMLLFPLDAEKWPGPCPASSPAWEAFVTIHARSFIREPGQGLAKMLDHQSAVATKLCFGVGNISRSEIIARARQRPDRPVTVEVFLREVVPAIRGWLADSFAACGPNGFNPFDRVAAAGWRQCLRAYGGVGDALSVVTSCDYGERDVGVKRMHARSTLWWSVKACGTPEHGPAPLFEAVRDWRLRSAAEMQTWPAENGYAPGPHEFVAFKGDEVYAPVRERLVRKPSKPGRKLNFGKSLRAGKPAQLPICKRLTNVTKAERAWSRARTTKGLNQAHPSPMTDRTVAHTSLARFFLPVVHGGRAEGQHDFEWEKISECGAGTGYRKITWAPSRLTLEAGALAIGVHKSAVAKIEISSRTVLVHWHETVDTY